MPKTPDEIKKGLEEELPVHYHIDGEPRLTPRQYMELQWLHKDTLALVQQLQAENAEKDARIQQLEDHLREATKKVEHLQAERDAAVRDLTEMAQDTDESCEYCEMFETPHCSLECRMKNKGFKWRGVQKEE